MRWNCTTHKHSTRRNVRNIILNINEKENRVLESEESCEDNINSGMEGEGTR